MPGLKTIFSKVKAILLLALLSLVVIDLSYLTYEHRVKTYLFAYIKSKVVSPSVLGSPNVCENNTWWFNASATGSHPWQHILQEENEFPLAYTIMAFERPDQVSWWQCQLKLILMHLYSLSDLWCTTVYAFDFSKQYTLF